MELIDPDGRTIELTGSARDHIGRRHANVRLADVQRAIATPLEILPGNRPAQAWYYGIATADSRYLRVVVAFYAEDRDVVVTAFLRSRIP